MGRNPSRSATTSALLACGVAGMLTLAACSSSSPQPSWIAALGTGVTVVAPHSVAPGHGSPGAVLTGLATATVAKNFTQMCDYAEPSYQAGCRSAISKEPTSKEPTIKNFALGYTVIDGNRAVVGMTGTGCDPTQSPKCTTNSNQSAIFSTKKSFSALWSNAINPSAGYSLTPCIRSNGKWYLYTG